jgi:YD repeat-containing protein
VATFITKRGATTPTISWTCTDQNGAIVNLTNATGVTFVMRAQTSSQPWISASGSITNAGTGAVSYTWTANDVSTAGRFDAEWLVTWTGGTVQRFPVQGYQSISIEEDLSTPGGNRLVTLEEIRDHLRMSSTDHTFDARLLRLLDAITVVIENETGPIIQRAYDEWYDGGNTIITTRRRPLVLVNSVTEYRGAIAYPLSQVQTPADGQIYSYMYDQAGRIMRRTVGGGITSFPPGPDSVHIQYVAGQAIVPPNVKEAAMHEIAVHFERTELGSGGAFGGGGAGEDSDLPTGPPIGFFLTGKARELLQPNRRFPSIA